MVCPPAHTLCHNRTFSTSPGGSTRNSDGRKTMQADSTRHFTMNQRQDTTKSITSTTIKTADIMQNYNTHSNEYTSNNIGKQTKLHFTTLDSVMLSEWAIQTEIMAICPHCIGYWSTQVDRKCRERCHKRYYSSRVLALATLNHNEQRLW